MAPLKLGSAEVLPALTKLAGALAVGNLHSAALRQLGAQVLRWQAQYEGAVALLLAAGAKGAAAGAKGAAAVQVRGEGHGGVWRGRWW